jgi:hypothetical protein
MGGAEGGRLRDLGAGDRDAKNVRLKLHQQVVARGAAVHQLNLDRLIHTKRVAGRPRTSMRSPSWKRSSGSATGRETGFIPPA